MALLSQQIYYTINDLDRGDWGYLSYTNTEGENQSAGPVKLANLKLGVNIEVMMLI